MNVVALHRKRTKHITCWRLSTNMPRDLSAVKAIYARNNNAMGNNSTTTDSSNDATDNNVNATYNNKTDNNKNKLTIQLLIITVKLKIIQHIIIII